MHEQDDQPRSDEQEGQGQVMSVGKTSEPGGAAGSDPSPVSTQKVMETRPVVTLIMDLDVQDGATVDKYFQFIYERGTTMLGMQQLIKEHVAEIRMATIWLLVGNCQIPRS